MTHRASRALAVGLLAVVALTFWAAPVPVGAHTPVANDAAVITRWNEITQRTLAENAVPVPSSGLYYAFVSLAMYDAVVTIKGGYEPWAEQPRAHARASAEVAAATAAYVVLRHYFPTSAKALASDFWAALRRSHMRHSHEGARGARHQGRPSGRGPGDQPASGRRTRCRGAATGRRAVRPGRVAAYAAGARADGRPLAGVRRPAAPAVPDVDPARGPTGAGQRSLRVRLRRGARLRRNDVVAGRGPDRDGVVLERERREPVPGCDARPGGRPWARHRGQRQSVRHVRRQRGGCARLVLASEVRLQLLAPRHRHRPRRYRRQRRDARGRRMDAAGGHPAVLGLHERARLHHRGASPAPWRTCSARRSTRPSPCHPWRTLRTASTRAPRIWMQRP